MSAETQTRLVYMANQIARNFAALGHDDAVAATLDAGAYRVSGSWGTAMTMVSRTVGPTASAPDCVRGSTACVMPDRKPCGLFPNRSSSSLIGRSAACAASLPGAPGY